VSSDNRDKYFSSCEWALLHGSDGSTILHLLAKDSALLPVCRSEQNRELAAILGGKIRSPNGHMSLKRARFFRGKLPSLRIFPRLRPRPYEFAKFYSLKRLSDYVLE